MSTFVDTTLGSQFYKFCKIMKTNSYFITGTDTGVGKTLVTTLLALQLQSRGIDVGVMKPIASGCTLTNGELVNDDAVWLRETIGVNDDLDLINPIRYEEPLAPLVAARRAGLLTTGTIATMMEAYRELCSRHEAVIVEGVGGLLVPIAEAEGRILTCVDLAEALGLPVIVVARRTLGTINHTLLTCRTPLKPPAHFHGLVFCDAEAVGDDDVAAETSPDLLCEITGLTAMAYFPFMENISPFHLREIAKTGFQLGPTVISANRQQRKG